MSEQPDQTPEPAQDHGTHETPEVGLIADEELPEDLQPEKNPLARNPGDEDDDSSDEPKVDGMPDLGQPG